MKELEEARELKKKLVEKLERLEVNNSKNRHDLDVFLQELEEKIHHIEADKLSEHTAERLKES